MATAASGGTDSAPLDAPTQAKVEQIVRQFQDTNHTPGVLVGIWSPRGTFVSATGVADLATGTPLSADMQFKIASQDKTFTANLILQLVGEGKVALADHISKWVPGVPNGDKITIRALLNHTSGLADGFTAPSIQVKVATPRRTSPTSSVPPDARTLRRTSGSPTRRRWPDTSRTCTR